MTSLGSRADSLRDEDDLRPVVVVRPLVEPCHRVQQMLGALNDSGAAWLLGDVDEPLDPQESRAKILRDAVEKELQLLA